MSSAQSAQVVSPAAGRRKRRAIPIIDARFQWKYTLIITALGAGITAVMGAFLYRAHADNTRLLELDGQLQAQVMRGDLVFLLYLIVLVVVMALALAFWGLVVTHRVSGPLYVIARYLGELAEGRYPDMRPLRKHDELQEFFATFEDAVTALRSRDGAALADIDAALASARAARDPKAALDETVRALERYRTTLAGSLHVS